MPPKNRGKTVPAGYQSKSTPNLPALQSAEAAEHNGSSASSHLRPIASTLDGALLTGVSIEDGDADSLSSSSIESDEEDLKLQSNRPLHTSRSHTHLPRQTTSALYPPFYNRPPTPLPPSPSLTSLLRPSRRTTPDSSDVELPSITSSTTTLVKSARHAPRIPRAAPKVPTYEYYGFALYLGSSAAFLMYILWAYVPAPVLHNMGIWYYPDRWWALAIPCWLIALIIYIYVALASWNTEYLTLGLSRVECLVDECAQVGVVDRRTGEIVGNVGGAGKSEDYDKYRFGVGEEVDWKSFWSMGTDAVLDVPIGGVCEILYGDED
ncbi:hypothetical protein HBI24_090250 [Parastagonospora nodorum]|nr:hypothetical protein HBI09_075300 [Parastagonospora nodorum]KAH5015710.1 hypothetical protein HBI77_062530 [Parastagonospora nodorum]KAH5584630.1 hypothetical protein HBI24_090250 [Parastagonospora nodorum]KAH6119501.1 hypothetical protein HBI64_173160 [Parastagonospora nodorum]